MTFKPENLVVWSEIPCVDLKKSTQFYSNVFDLELSEDKSGPNPVVMFPTQSKSGVAGHLYPGKPAARGTGPTIHFAVPDTLEETMERVKSNGGEVVSPIITIPNGSFVYCHDPDGNSLGIFKGA